MGNPAFESARRKGQQAARDGKSEWSCPYADKRTHDGSVTFSRAFERAWLEGFRSVNHPTQEQSDE